jgi:hypothetical protein
MYERGAGAVPVCDNENPICDDIYRVKRLEKKIENY